MIVILTRSSAGFKPFMEYAGSYALFNYRLEDPSRGLEYDNLRLIRAFEHGLDPKLDESKSSHGEYVSPLNLASPSEFQTLKLTFSRYVGKE